MQKNEERTGIINNLGMNGEGVLIDENKVVFVPYALPTEKIKYKVLKVSGNCVYGKVLEVLTPADERIRPKCPVFTKCGGCQLQHLRYENQLRHKETQIKNCFKKIANIDVEVSGAVKSSEFNYRNKLQLPVQETEKGTAIGFYAEGSHRVIEIEDCPINAPWTRDIIKSFKQYFLECGIKGYNEKDFSGDVREITVKEVKGKLIITVVSLSKNLKGTERLIGILKENLLYKFSLYLNINKKNNNVIYGDEFIKLYGEKDYSSEMLGIKYRIGVLSFMQVNTAVCNKLYKAVSESINADGDTVVFDAYSGAGLMTALLAKNAKKAIGVEIISEAVKLADELAKENCLQDKITNYCGKCEELLPDLIAKEKAKGEKISLVLDPPRKGVDIKVINAIAKSEIDKIVYVSCMPSTLARDVGLITGSLIEKDGQIVKSENPTLKYRVECVKPFDMFAQTRHVETLCVLTRI